MPADSPTNGPGDARVTPVLRRLRDAIGEHVAYEGAACLVHDVVDDPPLLVLRRLERSGAIQADKFGKAVRRAPTLVEIPVFAADGVTPSEALQRVSLPGTPGTR